MSKGEALSSGMIFSDEIEETRKDEEEGEKEVGRREVGYSGFYV